MTSDGGVALARPKVSLVSVGILTLLVSGASLAIRTLWMKEIKPQGAVVLPFALLFGLSVAVVLSLAWANRHRWRAVLRPSKGRVIGAVVLAGFTAFGLINWVPLTVFAMVVMTAQAFLDGTWTTLDLFPEGLVLLGAGVVVHLFWYGVSCMIVSGLHARWVRVATYTLLCWSSYSALVLFLGTNSYH